MDQALDPERGLRKLRPRRNALQYAAGWDVYLASPEAFQYAADLREAGEQFISWATATNRRRAAITHRFMKMHEQGPWAAFAGKEFHIDHLDIRVRDFLTAIVHLSEGQDDPSQKMTYGTLNTIRHDIYALHCQYLATVQDLPKNGRPKCHFGPPEALLLIETAITDNERSMDNNLQHIIAYLLMFYTAARPGSILRTQAYPNFYLRYKDIGIIRTSDPARFYIHITLCAWKGGHGLHPWSQSFRISPVRNENHLLLELAVIVIALGLRRGAFRDHTDLASLLKGKERTVQWKEELKDAPFLCAGMPRGLGVNAAKPLRYEGFRDFLRQLAAQAGLDPMFTTAYCFRRGTASTMNRVLGSELTKTLLHHKQASETLHKHYAGNAQQVDLTAASLYEEDTLIKGLSVLDAPAFMRPTGLVDDSGPGDLSLKAALVISDDLRLLHMQKCLLQDILTGGGGIENAGPVLETLLPIDKNFFERILLAQPAKTAEMDSQLDESEGGTLEALLAQLTIRCRRTFAKLRSRFRQSQAINNHAQGVEPTVEEIERRISDVELAGPLARVLDSLVESNTSDIITCSPLDFDGTEQEGSLDAARVRLMSGLIEYREPLKGPQVCPICNGNYTLPQAVLAWDHVKRHSHAQTKASEHQSTHSTAIVRGHLVEAFLRN
ncbi:hypothetical protein ACG7TL_003387 [Trametes sanguinea]